MAQTKELKVYQATYDLLSLILDAREHFPKTYKYEFGTHLMMRCVECCELIRWANSDAVHRAEHLQQFLVRFEGMRVLLRVCQDRKLVTQAVGAEMFLLVDSIERQATAWRNASLKPER